eukprot:6416127-Prymnesium_polylepis.1
MGGPEGGRGETYFKPIRQEANTVFIHNRSTGFGLMYRESPTGAFDDGTLYRVKVDGNEMQWKPVVVEGGEEFRQKIDSPEARSKVVIRNICEIAGEKITLRDRGQTGISMPSIWNRASDQATKLSNTDVERSVVLLRPLLLQMLPKDG